MAVLKYKDPFGNWQLLDGVSGVSIDGVEYTPDANGVITLPVDQAPTANSKNLLPSGVVKTEFENTNGAIAIVQTGDTATQTIDAGAFVMWKGVLYTADAAIPSGDPFATSGGSKNLTAEPNGGLNALNRPVTVMYYRYADGAGSHTFTIASNARLLLISTDSSVNSQGIWFISTTGAGAVVKKDVIAASDITLNTATANKLKITVAGFTRLKFEDLSGGNVAEKVSV